MIHRELKKKYLTSKKKSLFSLESNIVKSYNFFKSSIYKKYLSIDHNDYLNY